ncbi:MAG: hypothetical protein K8W52_04820 [Deltaproteobacteria bacterium]|nr:hypothetical protein [Deltaproteobacteria bacterium]
MLVGGAGDQQQQGVAVHVDASLAIVAARAFGGSARSGTSINQGGQVLNAIGLVNGGFVAAGDTYPTAAAAEGASWILALDDQLVTRWDRAIDDGVNRTGARAVASNGTRALVGSYAHPTASTTVLRISAFDDQSTTVTSAWVRQLDQLVAGAAVTEGVTAIARTAAGDYWVAGFSDTSGGFAGQVVKLDAAGALVTAVRLEGADDPILRTVVATADGGCVVAGDAGDHGLVAKLDASGAVTWQQAIGTTATSRITAAAAAPDGSIVLVGAHSADAWLVRLPSVDARPKDFGTAATTSVVAETPASTTPVTHAATWTSTSDTWAPTITELATLPVNPAP